MLSIEVIRVEGHGRYIDGGDGGDGDCLERVSARARSDINASTRLYRI